MENISNVKIEKLKDEIVKTKAKIAEFLAKLKEQEKLLVTYEDMEIVARFRNRNGNEDLAAAIKNEKQCETASVKLDNTFKMKEEALNETMRTE